MDNIVEVENLIKTFPPDIRAVDDISFNVKRGEIFGFLGPNGAGKSTTIKIITTLLKKSSGKVRIDGIDLDDGAGAIRDIIGYASQEVGVDDDLTGRENLRLQCRFHHLPKDGMNERVNEVLSTVGLSEAADRRANTYSGGMRKRLDLATALVARPKLLFLDEPTTGLDPQSRQAIWDYIKRLNKEGMTIFLTTQYLEEADRLANRLSIIDQGKIVAEGEPSKLKAQIGADQIQLCLREGNNPRLRASAIETLRHIPGVKEIKDLETGIVCEGGIIVYADNGPALVPQIVRALDDTESHIEQLTLSAPSLDDVFLRYTGKSLRVEEVKPAGRTGYSRRRRP